MTRGDLTESLNKPKPSSSRATNKPYPLRNQTSKNALHLTPSKLSPVRSCKLNTSPAPLTPSNKQCSVCQGMEDIRAKSYRELAKSLGENSTEHYRN